MRTVVPQNKQREAGDGMFATHAKCGGLALLIDCQCKKSRRLDYGKHQE